MSLIVFASNLDDYVGRLLSLVAEAAPWVEIEIHLTLESLVSRMRQSATAPQVVIVVAQTRADLDGLLTRRRFLTDRPVILIVPDREAATLSAGHRLGPRYLSVLESGPQAAAAVATRLLEAMADHRSEDRKVWDPRVVNSNRSGQGP